MQQRTTLLTCLIIICLLNQIAAQTDTQIIRGQVIDKDTQQPLIGATVTLADSSLQLGTVTDIDGKFRLTEVPLGRQIVVCNYLGYAIYRSDNLIVNAAREVVLDIELAEIAITTGEVVVSAFRHRNEALNDLSIVSTRSFSVEETQRYAASANDPSRMAMGFPGVQPSRDSRSDIVIRGNSGIGLLWRLEGIDIPNPNHFARRGSSGGGITVFSVSMLGDSDFSSGAFPAEYGNAFSGVFDINLRRGNREKRQYSFRAGMLGLDLAAEGPIKKGRSSYLINYRYSTLGLLNQMGIYLVNPRADNIFQDLSFKLHFPSKDNRQMFSIWGIGGLSDEFERAEDELNNRSTFSDKLTRDFQTDMGVLGMNYTRLINDKSYLKASLALSGQDIIFRNDTLNLDREATRINDEDYTTTRITVALTYSHKFTPQWSLKAGTFGNLIRYDFHQWEGLSDQRTTFLDSDGSTLLTQPYVQLRYRPSEKWTINFGLHAMFFELNNTTSVEPRLGIQWQASPNATVSLAYGLHSRIVPLGSYFTQVADDNGSLVQPNLDLELIKSHHLILAGNYYFKSKLRLQIEAYYQMLFDVPVGIGEDNTFSVLNTIDGYAKQALISAGEGRNMGLDISIEKFFEQGSFFLLSGSLFDSRYTDASGREHNTRYNSQVSASFMGGREWRLRSNSSLQLSLKLLFNGGARVTPLLPNAGGDAQNPPWDESRPFEERAASYFRPDLRIAYRKDRRRVSWTLSLDVQNIINRRNEDVLDRTYDPDTELWTERNQSGLTPVLSFQLDW